MASVSKSHSKFQNARKNSNKHTECSEMFDLYVDGTKIESSRFFSEWNVPLPGAAILLNAPYSKKLPVSRYISHKCVQILSKVVFQSSCTNKNLNFLELDER